MHSQARWFILPVILLVTTLACSLTSTATTTPPAAATLDRLFTAAALTSQATGLPTITTTPLSTATSSFPTFAFPTATPPTPQSVRCDAAAFIKDVSISDGTDLDNNKNFTKTWRLKNIGTCNWTPSYALVFAGGDRLGAPRSVGLAGYVNVGRFVDLSVDLTTPIQNGHYQGFWKLRNSTGTAFGIGPRAADAFWVDINVGGPSYTVYDFAINYCNASWENNNKDLDCPGTRGDDKGFVIKLDHPVLENGTTRNKAALLTVPKNSHNGFISGQYPAFNVRNGDRFQAEVNCQYKAYGCNVIFRLDYQIGNGDVRTIGLWNEVYEGKSTTIDLDLSSLAGKRVKFILKVTANGSADQDNAIWFAPHISRHGPYLGPKTPTPTPPHSSGY